jgi:hypothetical protein
MGSERVYLNGRFEVFTNLQPALDGQRWGWLEDRATGQAVLCWHGETERVVTEARAKQLNDAHPVAVREVPVNA